jgi:hypothetical protein
MTDPFASGQLRIEADDIDAPGLPPEFASGEFLPGMLPRRADIDVKQEQLGRILESIGVEGALLLVPSHVSWFTNGMNLRGLLADSERPGIYTNGKQRWLLCSNVDTHRLFDEELDQLGFQLKEWNWENGRAELLMNVTTGRKVASDRPFPNMPQLSERLRPLLRILSPFEQDEYRELGKIVAHAVEATARNFARGQSEEEVAGQLGHRLLHRGVEPAAISVTADSRGEKFRRAGFTSAVVQHSCVIQATGQRDGQFLSASRTVCFGPLADDMKNAYEMAVKLAAVYRSLSKPEESMGTANAAGQLLQANTQYEYDWRLSQPGYGAGRFPAEELRRAAFIEPFSVGQALVWQPRIGPAAIVDTVIVNSEGPEVITPTEGWPFKRVMVQGHSYDIPDVLIKET